MGDVIEFIGHPTVELIDFMGNDTSVAQAARVSLKGANQPTSESISGLINYLMSARHGTPFEMGVMKFYVKAPIFVFREFHRHRLASYNEMSGRYSVLPPEFYVPNENRTLINSGTSARPEMVKGTDEQVDRTRNILMSSYVKSWDAYQLLLDDGIANEVARMVLPVGIFSQMYVSMNLRSLMNFFSLRVDSPDATVRSRPQREIQDVAELMEAEFARIFPIVYDAFLKNGRVAP